MIIEKNSLFLMLGFQLLMTPLWCNEIKACNEIELKTEQEERVHLDLADILFEFEDLPTSLYLYNQLIEKKEKIQCYDTNYSEALRRASYLYSLVDRDIALKLLEKLNTRDEYIRNLPKWEIENGYLVADKVFPELLGKNGKLFLTKVILSSGLCESEADIEFSNEQIRIKLTPCCTCRKLDK